MPPFQIGTDTNVGDPAVTFDGVRYWVVWRNFDAPEHVRVLALDTAGQPLGAPQTVLDTTQTGGRLDVGAVAPGQILVGYSELDDTLGNFRVRLRLASFSP